MSVIADATTERKYFENYEEIKLRIILPSPLILEICQQLNRKIVNSSSESQNAAVFM